MWNVWWGVADMTEVWGWWARHSTPDLYCFARSSALPSHEWTFQPAWAQQPSSNIRTGLLQCSSVDLLKFVCTCTFVSYLSITFCSSFVFFFYFSLYLVCNLFCVNCCCSLTPEPGATNGKSIASSSLNRNMKLWPPPLQGTIKTHFSLSSVGMERGTRSLN